MIYTIEDLHLCTIKTPTLSAVMSEQGVADCAFQMRNGVKRHVLHIFSFKTPTSWAVMSEKGGNASRFAG